MGGCVCDKNGERPEAQPHSVVSTEVGSAHPTGMHSCLRE